MNDGNLQMRFCICVWLKKVSDFVCLERCRMRNYINNRGLEWSGTRLCEMSDPFTLCSAESSRRNCKMIRFPVETHNRKLFLKYLVFRNSLLRNNLKKSILMFSIKNYEYIAMLFFFLVTVGLTLCGTNSPMNSADAFVLKPSSCYCLYLRETTHS